MCVCMRVSMCVCACMRVCVFVVVVVSVCVCARDLITCYCTYILRKKTHWTGYASSHVCVCLTSVCANSHRGTCS